MVVADQIRKAHAFTLCMMTRLGTCHMLQQLEDVCAVPAAHGRQAASKITTLNGVQRPYAGRCYACQSILQHNAAGVPKLDQMHMPISGVPRY